MTVMQNSDTVPDPDCVPDGEQSCLGFSPSLHNKNAGFALNHLPPDERSQVYELLCGYDSIFQDMPGRTTRCTHAIQLLPDTKPIRSAPCRVNPEKAKAMKEEIELMLRLGINVEHSSSAFAAPVVLVPKVGSRSLRFCCDFRRMNLKTIPDSYPMPRIDELIDKVGQTKFLTKIDLSRGF